MIESIIDIKDMPRFNGAVANGADSVSTGKITLKFNESSLSRFWQRVPKNIVHQLRIGYYPTCHQHGAILCVSEDCKIWRCPMCNEDVIA